MRKRLASALNSVIGRQQIDAVSREIIGQANINTDEIRSIKIPLPPPSKQDEIMKEVFDGLSREKMLRKEADDHVSKAGKQIEAAILGEAHVR